MLKFILRRLLLAIPMLLVMSFVTFFFIYITPGDVMGKYKAEPEKYGVEHIEQMERDFHFNEPFVIQYGYWLKNVVSGNWGYSFSQEEKVSVVISSHLANTLILSLFSIFVTWLIVIPLGIYAAVHQYSIVDKIFSVISYFGMAIPNFFLALLLIYIVSVWDTIPVLGFIFPFIGDIPNTGGMKSDGFDGYSFFGKFFDILGHMIIPTVVLASAAMAGLQRIMRGNMLETLRQPYITTARAKGLSENKVVYKHALRNAINPLITIFGYQFAALLSGAALTEMIVQWPGLGNLMLKAIRAQDTFLVMANMLMGGVMLVVGNLIADILLAYTDPRIRTS